MTATSDSGQVDDRQRGGVKRGGAAISEANIWLGLAGKAHPHTESLQPLLHDCLFMPNEPMCVC